MNTEISKEKLPAAKRVELALAEKQITEDGLIKLQGFKELILNPKIVDGVIIYEPAVLKEIQTARKQVKATRVLIEKEAKAQRDDANAFIKENIAFEKKFVALISPTEDHLQAQEDELDGLKELIRQEAENAAQQLLEDRMAKLIGVGGKFTATSLECYGLEFSRVDLKMQGEDWFNAKYAEIKVLHDAEVKRIADEKAEQKRIADENAAEKLRLEKVAQEQREAQDKIDKANKAIADENARIAKEKQDAIDKEKRDAEMESAKKLAAENALKQAEEKRKADELAKIEADRLAKEKAERKAARQPDKVKLISFIDELANIKFPELIKSPEAKAILDMTETSLTAIIDKMRELTNKL
jgi:hypothetical protein